MGGWEAREVRSIEALWHLGCTLSSINSEKIVNLLDGNSSNPTNINKMLD